MTDIAHRQHQQWNMHDMSKLTVKDTMLDTSVVRAEGMNVSCFGIGLMRRLTFCRQWLESASDICH